MKHSRNIRNSQFRDNAVIYQGNTYIHLPHRPARAIACVTPYPRNEDFVCRSDIIAQLSTLLPRTSSNYHSAALWGLGGSGKTQIALDYMYRQCSTRSVFWVHADSRATFTHDYKVIARKLCIDEMLNDIHLLTAVRNRIETEAKWLLVLDNADDLALFGVGQTSTQSDALANFIPRGPNGIVLWTSRDKQIVGTLVGPRRGIEVAKMAFNEAEEFLAIATATIRNRPASEEARDIRTLLEELQYHALAISQAGAYMRRTSTSVREYAIMLKQKKKRLLLLEKSEFDRHRQPGGAKSILATWSISIERIQQECQIAYEILHIMAYFNNKNIDMRLIETAGTLSSSKPGKDELDQAMIRLQDFSFVNLYKEEGVEYYAMHKLVQEAARHGLHISKPPEERNRAYTTEILPETDTFLKGPGEKYFSRIALIVISSICQVFEKNKWVLVGDISAHALELTGWMELCGEEPPVSQLLSSVSKVLGGVNRWREKELVDKRVLKIRQKILGEEHPDRLESIAALTLTYLGLASKKRDYMTEKFEYPARMSKYAQYKIKRAERLGGQLLRFRKTILGQMHPDTISSMKTIAEVYRGQGRYTKAKSLLERVLKLEQESLGEKHPNTLTTMEDLAFLFYTHGRRERALSIRRKVLELQRETSGEKHPATIWARHNLAISWKECGKHRGAISLMRQCYQDQREVFGIKHRLTMKYHIISSVWEMELKLQKGALRRAIDKIWTGARRK